MYEELLLTGVLLLFLTKMAWDRGQRAGNKRMLNHMSLAPNVYRLFDRLLMKLNRRPFSFITWTSLAWGASMMLTCFLLIPTGLDLLVFLIGAAACSMNFYIRQAPLYPLLAIFAMTLNPLWLILIVLTKEQGLWIASGYLFFTGADLIMFFWVATAGFIYIAIRYRIGHRERSEGGAPFFTPPYVVQYLRKKPHLVAINLVAVVTIVIFSMMKGLLGIQMILWTAALVCLFALWWEPQLWFPTFILLIGGVIL